MPDNCFWVIVFQLSLIIAFGELLFLTQIKSLKNFQTFLTLFDNF